RGVHALPEQPTSSETFAKYSRSSWRDERGTDAIELYRIPRMAHGTPVDASTGYGHGAPFMLDVGVSSTVEIARTWGLAASFERRERPKAEVIDERPAIHPSGGAGNKIQSVIENALRSAGLMK
ncbi:hypothetical protein J2Y63_007093, partial [Shinella sp. BE166]